MPTAQRDWLFTTVKNITFHHEKCIERKNLLSTTERSYYIFVKMPTAQRNWFFTTVNNITFHHHEKSIERKNILSTTERS